MGNVEILLIAIVIFLVVSVTTSVLVYKIRMKRFREKQER